MWGHMTPHLLGQVGEVLSFPTGEEVEAEPVRNQEEEIKEDKWTDDVLCAHYLSDCFVFAVQKCFRRREL